MTIKDMREWLNSLPDTFDEYPLVIVESVHIIENAPDKFMTKHAGVCTCLIDEKTKEGCLFNTKNIDEFDRLTQKENNDPE